MYFKRCQYNCELLCYSNYGDCGSYPKCMRIIDHYFIGWKYS